MSLNRTLVYGETIGWQWGSRQQLLTLALQEIRPRSSKLITREIIMILLRVGCLYEVSRMPPPVSRLVIARDPAG